MCICKFRALETHGRIKWVRKKMGREGVAYRPCRVPRLRRLLRRIGSSEMEAGSLLDRVKDGSVG